MGKEGSQDSFLRSPNGFHSALSAILEKQVMTPELTKHVVTDRQIKLPSGGREKHDRPKRIVGLLAPEVGAEKLWIDNTL